jgi:hypothetical protein
MDTTSIRINLDNRQGNIATCKSVFCDEFLLKLRGVLDRETLDNIISEAKVSAERSVLDTINEAIDFTRTDLRECARFASDAQISELESEIESFQREKGEVIRIFSNMEASMILSS